MTKYLIGMVAVVLAIAGSAFTAHKNHPAGKTSVSGPWFYQYNLSTATGENTPSNYTFISPQPDDASEVEGCNGADIPCVILATGSSGTMGRPDNSAVDASHLAGNTQTKKAAQQ